MTTYTVIDSDGYEIALGLTIEQAAHEVLTSDGREYEVREEPDGSFTLWARQQVANRPWAATRFFSIKTDRVAAEEKIFTDVVNSERFSGHCEAITDEQFAEMKAAALADDDDEQDTCPEHRQPIERCPARCREA